MGNTHKSLEEITRVHSSQRRVFDGLSNITQVSTFFAAVVGELASLI